MTKNWDSLPPDLEGSDLMGAEAFCQGVKRVLCMFKSDLGDLYNSRFDLAEGLVFFMYSESTGLKVSAHSEVLCLLIKGEGKWLLSQFSSHALGQSSLYSWWRLGKMAAATWGQHGATGSPQGLCKVAYCSPSDLHFFLSQDGRPDFVFLKRYLYLLENECPAMAWRCCR